MRIKDLLSEERAAIPPRPRNFVAKNAKMGGAGQHKDKKKAEKQGDTKHKKDLATMESQSVAEAVEDRTSYQVAKVLHDHGIKYDPAREDELIKVIELALVKKLAIDPRQVRGIMNDEDFLGDTFSELQHMSQDVEEAGMYRRPGSPTAYDRDYRSSVSGMGKKDSMAYQQDGGANDEGWPTEPNSGYQAPQDKPMLKGYYFYNVQPGQEDDAAMYGVKQTKSGKWAKAKYSTSGRSFDMQKDSADKAFGAGKWWAPK